MICDSYQNPSHAAGTKILCLLCFFCANCTDKKIYLILFYRKFVYSIDKLIYCVVYL